MCWIGCNNEGNRPDPRELELEKTAPMLFGPAAADETVIYRGGVVIDGTGAAPRSGLAVVTTGERIVAVVPTQELAAGAWGEAETVELDGAFILPGLIDTHQHLATPPNRPVAESALRRHVYSGITAVRDMADDLRQIADLTRATLVGEIPGPDIYYAALMAGTSFFDDPRTHAVSRGLIPGQVPWMQAIDSATDLRLAVAMARGTGATAVKIYADLDGELVAAITTEAHAQGMQVWAHAAVFPALPEDVIEAGVDGVSHVTMLAYQLMDESQPRTYRENRRTSKRANEQALTKPKDALDPILEKMRDRGTILDATCSLFRHSQSEPSDEAVKAAEDVSSWLTARAHRLGVQITVGSDYETPADDEFPALHQELRFLAEHTEMSPAEIIRAATLVGARSIGLAELMGTVEQGKLANLVIVSDDPHEDIENLRSVITTVKRGRRFERRDYAVAAVAAPGASA